MIYLHRFQVSDYKNSNLSAFEDFDAYKIIPLKHGKNPAPKYQNRRI